MDTDDPRLRDLFSRWVEEHALHGVELDPAEICRDNPELLPQMRRRIEKYRRVVGLLAPPAPTGVALAQEGRAGNAVSPVAPKVDSPVPVALAPGQVLGDRYRIETRLGAGGMGEVWRAHDLKLRVDVALKAMRAEVLGDDRATELLRREVRAARGVVSPHVCRVFDLVELEGVELVSMECVEGTTLRDLVAECGPLPRDEAQEIATQLLAGLEAIHAVGLVHRDIKPENVMRSRSGRVVVMDFGLSRAATTTSQGSVSGTPVYMAPEQLRGEPLDSRADVYSAGMVLAELVAPGGTAREEARRRLWDGLHRDPPEVPETPWAEVLRRALAADREKRPASAAELARALQERTLRAVGADDARPYPGLDVFTEADARFFFGRETDVEAMWRKLHRPRLLALIGPSGAGKSSFLRAGLLPARPAGWQVIVVTPGSRPFTRLASALLPEVRSETGAVERLLRFEEPAVAVALVDAWRRRGQEALLVVDQFEELFAQNPESIQERFVRLLARLALEAEVHVLIAMRDDFLFHCHRFEALEPVFSELTPLGAPEGEALRRAIVQPALKCGFRFEDEALVEEMAQEVESERGALPLIAFACAQLWQQRDRERGLLTRAAYEEIGGVAGALARHAEATLERIGSERVPIVRELFRNLVTAQGTRAARDRAELLSVFPSGERGAVDAVLDTLIDARLLVSYESSH